MTQDQNALEVAFLRHGSPPVAGGEQSVDSLPRVDFAALAGRLIRLWWVISLCLAAGAAVAAAYIVRAPRIYVSTATIRVEQEKRPLVPGTDPGGGREDIRAIEMLKTIEQGLTSQNNFLRVIQSNRLREDADFAPAERGEVSDSALIWRLEERVRAELRRGTRLIDVKVEDTNPERARRLAQSVVDEFVKVTSEDAIRAARDKARSLRTTSSELSAQIGELNAQLQIYREKHKDLSLDKDANIVGEKLKDLNAKLTQASADRNRWEAALRQIEGQGPNPDIDAVLKVQGVSEMTDIATLKSGIAQKEAEFARLQKRYGPKHPKHIQAQVELAGLKRELARTARNLTQSLATAGQHAQATEFGLREQIARQQTLALELERVLGPFRLLQSQLHSSQSSFEAVQSQIKQADVAAVAAPITVSLTDRPVAAATPSKPQKKLILALGSVTGMLLGLLIVFASSLLSRFFSGVEEAERTLNVPALAAIPRVRTGSLREALLDESTIEQRCGEAFRTLRASLSCLGRTHPAKSILFTSATAGEGTSFVAMNHAVSLARQGFRTLLIDANLHRPSLDPVFFDQPNTNGLANFLQGRPEAGRACRPTHLPELYLLSAGSSDAAQPSELLTGPKMAALLEDAQRWFHRIVIDAPPLGVSSDALVMAQRCGGVVLVVNRRVPKKAVRAAMRRLALSGRAVAGFVLNAVNGNIPPWLPSSDNSRKATDGEPGRSFPLALRG